MIYLKTVENRISKFEFIFFCIGFCAENLGISKKQIKPS